MNQNYDPNFCYDPIYSGFDQYQPPQFPEIHYPPQATVTELLQARENLMETIQAFLKEYDHIPPNEKCMALLLAEERFLKIKQSVEEEQNEPEAEQEEQAAKSFTPYENFSMIHDVEVLMKDIYTFLRKFSQLISKVLEDVRNINEELSEYINCPNWNRPTFYNDDDEYTIIYRKTKAITPDLPIEEPNNSLSMGDVHLNIIPETEKSSVDNLVPIPCEFKGISEDICDVPSCDYFDAECGLINTLLSRDISITSPKIDFLHEEFVVEDEILREKLLNVNLLIDKIKALKLTPSIPFVLENPSFIPMPVMVNTMFGLTQEEGKIVVFKNVEDDVPSIFVTFGLLLRFFITLWNLLFFSPPGVKTPFLTPSSPLRVGGISLGWDFHDCPDFEDSRVHGFVHSYIRASYPQLHLRNPIS
ncbi:hypothetical protein Tco_0736214 [Tanacetum coccineum]